MLVVSPLGRNGEMECTGAEQRRLVLGRRRPAMTRGPGEGSAIGLDTDLCNHGEGSPLRVGGGRVQCT